MKTKDALFRLTTPASVVALIATLSACGGGGGGSLAPNEEDLPGDHNPPIATLEAGTFIKTAEASDGSYFSLFNAANPQVRYMFLYPAADIAGSGNLSGLMLQLAADEIEETVCENTTIRVGHTSLSAVDGVFANNVEQGKGSVATVIDSTAVTIPAGSAADFFTIPFDSPFHYNGVDNLIVEVARSAACSNTAAVLSKNPAGYNAAAFHTASDVAPEATTVSPTRPSAKFVFAGGDARIEPDGTVSGNYNPFTNNASGRRVQALYPSAEIDGSGPIVGLAVINHLPTTVAETYTLNVSLGHTTLDALGTTFADNVDVGSPMMVAEGLDLVVPAGLPAGTMIWLPLTDTFEYDDAYNLVVDIAVTNAPTELVSWRVANVAPGRRIHAAVDSATGTAGSLAPYIGLRFYGGTLDRVSAAGVGDPWVFPNLANGIASQALYLSSDLGTGGTVTRVACRMHTVASNEIDYPNFEVIMSHTDATALVEDMDTNVPEPVVVFDGTFTTPFGLNRGDWIEIPLTTAFDYDGTRNLVIQTRSAAGNVAHACTANEDQDRYAGHYGGGITRNTSLVAVDAYQRDLRLWITK